MILLSLVAPSVNAELYVEEQHGEATAGEHEKHEFHRHHVSVFLGATTAEVATGRESGEAGPESEGGEEGEETRSETDGSIGLDYEYRLSRTWGVAVGCEYVGGDTRNWMAGVGVMLHPAAGLKLLAGPGVENDDGESEFLFRVGMMYDFEVRRWTLAPAINVDFIDGGEEAYVYGIYIGRGF